MKKSSGNRKSNTVIIAIIGLILIVLGVIYLIGSKQEAEPGEGWKVTTKAEAQEELDDMGVIGGVLLVVGLGIEFFAYSKNKSDSNLVLTERETLNRYETKLKELNENLQNNKISKESFEERKNKILENLINEVNTLDLLNKRINEMSTDGIISNEESKRIIDKINNDIKKSKNKKTSIICIIIVMFFVLGLVSGMINSQKRVNKNSRPNSEVSMNESNSSNKNNLINKNNLSNVKTANITKISNIGSGYAFVEKFNGNWDLVDLNGNLIFEIPDDYEPDGKVINGYFFAKDKNGIEDLRFYKIDGTQPFEGKEVSRCVGFLGEKITTDNYIYLVKTKSTTKDLDGKNTEEKLYCINENLEDYTDKVSWKNIIANDGKYAITSRIMYYDYDDVYNPGFQMNPKETRYLDVYIKENNGYFAHMKDDEKLYTPIEGTVYQNYGSTTDVLAKINEKYYIVKEDGNMKEVDYMTGYSCISFYDGYIVAYATGTKVLFDPNGNQIEFNI